MLDGILETPNLVPIIFAGVRISLALDRAKANVFLHIKFSETSCPTHLTGRSKGSPAKSIPICSFRANQSLPIRGSSAACCRNPSDGGRRKSHSVPCSRSSTSKARLSGAASWLLHSKILIGSVALTKTVAAASDSAWRKSHGGDLRLAVYLAGLLAQAPKDRSADYLCDAKDHPILADFWRAMERDSRLLLVRDQALGLPRRAVAALSALGVGGGEGGGHVSRIGSA